MGGDGRVLEVRGTVLWRMKKKNELMDEFNSP